MWHKQETFSNIGAFLFNLFSPMKKGLKAIVKYFMGHL